MRWASGGIGQQLLNGGGLRIDIRGRYKQAGFVFDEDVGNGPAAGADDGQSGGHTFDQNAAEGFWFGGNEDQQVGSQQQARDIYAETREMDVVGDA